MTELPDMVPLASTELTLWSIRRNARWLCTSANNLCNAVDRLGDLPNFDTEAEAALNNAVTALSFALSAATEKRDAILQQRRVQKLMRPWDQLVQTLVESE